MKIAAVWLMAGVLLRAQSGAPVHLDYACPQDDLDSFGLDCSADDPCGVFLEIAAAEEAGSKLFVTGNLHTESTTLYGIVLASEDGGRTWTEPVKRVRSAALEQIEFLDYSHGWIGGQLIEPLPRDPFLLATTDGGATWTEKHVFDDARYGSIGQFWFDSPEHGEMVIDDDGARRHTRYESSTGGEKWDARESSAEPIRLRTARSAAYRVRADAPTKTYRLEKRAGSAWETAASFLIHVADCK